MTTLLPTLYADRNRSTFFDVGGTLITVAYELSERKTWLLFPAPSLARLTINVGDGAAVITYEYPVPRNGRVGPEIAGVERGLYNLLDEAVRSTLQIKMLEAAEKEVEALEAEHLFGEEGAARHPAAAAADARRSRERELQSELGARLIMAARLVTNVTSLSEEGLEAHQRDRAHALERVVQSTSLTSTLEAQGVLGAVETFLAHEVETTTDVKVLRERTLDYLERLRERGGESAPALSYQQANILVNEFVPAYVEMKKKHDAATLAPSNVVEHAFGSFFGGGFAGWVTLSVLAEPVINGITGLSLDIPGWYIGAAVAFVWPYLRAALGIAKRDVMYERRRERLLRRLSQRLELAWPEEEGKRGA
jgi:hypothetical protein